MSEQFDQIDEVQLNDLGITEKLIKPFDSSRFIQRCRSLLDQNATFSDMQPMLENAPEETKQYVASEEEQSWTVQAPVVEMSAKPSIEEVQPTPSPINILVAETESWGVPVPGVIGDQGEQTMELPPVIDEVSISFTIQEPHKIENKIEVIRPEKIAEVASKIEMTKVSAVESSLVKNDEAAVPSAISDVLPSQDDLAYPDEISSESLTQETLSTKLIPLTDLAPEELAEAPISDEQTGSIDLSQFGQSLETEIQEDIEDDFWSADIEKGELVAARSEESRPISPTGVVSVSSIDLGQLDSYIPAPKINEDELIDKIKKGLPSINEEEIFVKLKAALPPLVEQYMKDYCAQTVERVVWEIIPDLAENLIRKELKNIAESVNKD